MTVTTWEPSHPMDTVLGTNLRCKICWEIILNIPIPSKVSYPSPTPVLCYIQNLSIHLLDGGNYDLKFYVDFGGFSSFSIDVDSTLLFFSFVFDGW